MIRTNETVERENNFKGRCNVDSFELNQHIDKIYTFTGVKLPNFIEIYRKKVWEFEEFFEKKGINFFDNYYLRAIAMSFLDIIVIGCYKDYLLFATSFANLSQHRSILKKVLKKVGESIALKIDLLRSLDVKDLPQLLDAGINNKELYSALLPDTINTFTNKCLDELKELEFDMEKEVNIKSLLLGSAQLKLYSEERIEKEGLDERIKAFELFTNSLSIDIDSNIFNDYKKNQRSL